MFLFCSIIEEITALQEVCVVGGVGGRGQGRGKVIIYHLGCSGRYAFIKVAFRVPDASE